MANPKRLKIERMILDTVKLMEPGGTNYELYKQKFASMDDKAFEKFMTEIKDGKRKLPFMMPNMKVVLQQKDLVKAADACGAEIFSKITYEDPVTGITYTTPHECIVLNLPVRRTRQFLQHGLSVPEGDSRVDSLTGQVMKPDQASKFSFVEMQLLRGRGMDATIREFMKIRGGDLDAYASYKQQLEETGTFSQESLNPNSMPRTVMVLHTALRCMGIGNNFVEQNPGGE